MAFFKIPLEQVVVVHDDLDLELGQIKLKRGGSSGALLRGGVVGHVLGGFKGKDAEEAEFLVENCADAVESLIADGLEKAQLRFHSLKPKG
jgi:PTH1 family peptidyl-tRNA hydrolase